MIQHVPPLAYSWLAPVIESVEGCMPVTFRFYMNLEDVNSSKSWTVALVFM
jgi:hypothetical protein